MKVRRIVFTILGISLILALATGCSSDANQRIGVPDEELQYQIADISGPLYFQQNSDFSTQGFPGDGTSGNPYIIENLSIVGDFRCLGFYGITVYFIVRNCSLTAIGSWGNAIEFQNCQNAIISNNTIYECSNTGIYVYKNSNSTIANNSISDCGSDGIYIYGDDSCQYLGNTIIDCGGAGIRVSGVKTNVTIANNSFQHSGLVIEGSDNLPDMHWLHHISNNTLNGKPIGYFREMVDQVIDASGFSQIIFAECRNVTVQNGTFVDGTRGVQFGRSYLCVLENCTVENNSEYAYFENLGNNRILNNTFLNNDQGVWVERYTTLTNNIFVNNGIMMQDNSPWWDLYLTGYNTANGKQIGYFNGLTDTTLDGSLYGQLIFYDCTNVVVSGGNLHDVTVGLQVSTCINCTFDSLIIEGNREEGVLINNWMVEGNCTIIDTTIRFNGLGAFLRGPSIRLIDSVIEKNDRSGIEARTSVSPGFEIGITIEGNNISANGEHGVYIVDSYECYVTHNNISYNQVEGIRILGGTNHTIYGNTFGWNNVRNAYDQGGSNEWDNGIVGNRWSDYTGLTLEYFVQGGGGSKDRFPEFLPSLGAPAVTTPDDFAFHVDETNVSIQWTALSSIPNTYNIYRNGSLQKTGSWQSGTPFGLLLDGTPIGNYYYTLRVADDLGRENIDIVFVDVLPKHLDHDNIVINGNNEFEGFGFEGDGTSNSPYIIERLNITGYPGVNISNTDCYFIIQNCYVSMDLRFENVTNGVIKNCTIFGDYPAIFIFKSSTCSIFDTFIYADSSGIWLSGSNNCDVYNVTVISADSLYNDIGAMDSVNCRIHDNVGEGYTYSIYLRNCSLFEVYNHTILGTENGIYLEGCENVWMYMNYIQANTHGIYIDSSPYCNITDSQIAGDMAGIYNYNSNYTVVDNVFLVDSEVGFYLTISNTVSIRNSMIEDCIWGIQGFHLFSMTIEKNSITHCEGCATEFTDSRFIILVENAISENSGNPFIVGTIGAIQFFSTTDSMLIANNITFNELYGVAIDWTSENTTSFLNRFAWNAFGNAIANGTNTNWDNGTTGNWWSDYYGGGFYYVTGTANSMDRFPMQLDVTPPSISSPDDIEIDEGSLGCVIVWNVTDEYPCYFIIFRDGEVVRSGEWNTSMTQITESLDGLAPGEYNYTLLVSDCIFNVTDTVYVTVIAFDDPIPEINSPDDLTITEGALGYNIEWYPTDNNPGHYEIYLNETLLEFGNWTSGNAIDVSLDGLSAGVHVYMIVVSDIYWMNATDTVIVTVISIPVDIDSPEDVHYEMGNTHNTITWAVLNGTPVQMALYRNGSLIIATSWSGDSYTINVDYLPVGSHNFTIIVWDAKENTDRDTVWVRVAEEITPPTTTATGNTTVSDQPTELPEFYGMFSLVITLGSITVIVVVVVLVYRSREVVSYGFEYS